MSNQAEMPRYRCHKEVGALKIESVELQVVEAPPEDSVGEPVESPVVDPTAIDPELAKSLGGEEEPPANNPDYTAPDEDKDETPAEGEADKNNPPSDKDEDALEKDIQASSEAINTAENASDEEDGGAGEDVEKHHASEEAASVLTTPALGTPDGALLIPENKGYAPIAVDQAFVDKHKPQAGGYYVQYKDGYTSYSPMRAFEEGYRLL